MELGGSGEPAERCNVYGQSQIELWQLSCSNLDTCQLLEQRLPAFFCNGTQLKPGRPTHKPSHKETEVLEIRFLQRHWEAYISRRSVRGADGPWAYVHAEYRKKCGHMPSFTAIKPRHRSAATVAPKLRMRLDFLFQVCIHKTHSKRQTSTW